MLKDNINVINVKMWEDRMSKLDAKQSLDYVNLRCIYLAIVHRPGQTLTDNTDIIDSDRP